MKIMRVHMFLFCTIAAVGVGLGCYESEAPLAQNCWEAAGNATCEEAFGSEVQWYCTTEAAPCGVEAPLGCVTERPGSDECYSPCGGGRSAIDGEQCVGEGGVADDSPDGDGKTRPYCGNGLREAGEICDLGEANGGDQCNFECQSAQCGDGHVQAELGEECDDGGLESGDRCTARCQLPGQPLAQDNSLAEYTRGWAVSVDSDGNVFAVSSDYHGMVLTKFPRDLTAPMWTTDALPTAYPNLTMLGDHPIVGGRDIGARRATVAMVENGRHGGRMLWVSPVVEEGQSLIASVAAAEGHIVAAGYRVPRAGGIVARIAKDGQRVKTTELAEPLGRMAVDPKGRVWALGVSAPELLSLSLQGNLEVYPLDPGHYVDIAVDKAGGVYVLVNDPQDYSFSVVKLDANGQVVWTGTRYEEARAGGMVVIGEGTVLVAGTSEHAEHGVLAWYDGDTGELFHRTQARSPSRPMAMFEDVAIAPSGDFAVAVGGAGVTEARANLWLYEFEI